MMDISNNADVPRSAQESNGKDENQTVEGPGPTHTGEFNERINISNGSSPFILKVIGSMSEASTANLCQGLMTPCLCIMKWWRH